MKFQSHWQIIFLLFDCHSVFFTWWPLWWDSLGSNFVVQGIPLEPTRGPSDSREGRRGELKEGRRGGAFSLPTKRIREMAAEGGAYLSFFPSISIREWLAHKGRELSVDVRKPLSRRNRREKSCRATTIPIGNQMPPDRREWPALRELSLTGGNNRQTSREWPASQELSAQADGILPNGGLEGEVTDWKIVLLLSQGCKLGKISVDTLVIYGFFFSPPRRLKSQTQSGLETALPEARWGKEESAEGIKSL